MTGDDFEWPRIGRTMVIVGQHHGHASQRDDRGRHDLFFVRSYSALPAHHRPALNTIDPQAFCLNELTVVTEIECLRDGRL